MSAVAKRRLTPEEYLVVERAAQTKSEFLDGEMFAMAGASFRHTLIKENLSCEIGTRLRGGPCVGLSGDMRVHVKSTGLYTYPDYLVFCGKPQFLDSEVDTLLNPSVIIEILSDSTEKYDRGAKFKHYRSLPSLKEYVLISQDDQLIDRYIRQPDDSWLLSTFDNPSQEIELVSVGVRIPLADIYRGVDFSK